MLISLALVQAFRPPRTDASEFLFKGISYERRAHAPPRPLVIHIVEIDLSNPGIDFLVTPGDSSAGLEIPARTTSAFLEEFTAQVAINGNYFKPFVVGNPLWGYYPYSGDPVYANGLAISDGVKYSDEETSYPVLCITADSVEIRSSGCPEGTQQAIAGRLIFVEDGQATVQDDDGSLHPRTAVALDAEAKKLWLIVVDGRQSGYSEGATLDELANIAIELGADRALNLDGGGSSTLVMMTGGKAKVLNSPIHTRIPMRERPVANHLGVYAQPLDEIGE